MAGGRNRRDARDRKGYTPLQILNDPVLHALHSPAPEPQPRDMHCNQCTQRFADWEDRFRCRWGCYGDLHAECQLLHHEEHDMLTDFNATTREAG